MRRDKFARKIQPTLAAERDAAMNRAYVHLHMAKKSGKVVPLDCEHCGASASRSKPMWKDYDRPLQVTWLCFACKQGERARRELTAKGIPMKPLTEREILEKKLAEANAELDKVMVPKITRETLDNYQKKLDQAKRDDSPDSYADLWIRWTVPQ